MGVPGHFELIFWGKCPSKVTSFKVLDYCPVWICLNTKMQLVYVFEKIQFIMYLVLLLYRNSCLCQLASLQTFQPPLLCLQVSKKYFKTKTFFTPLSTTALLTPFLIGSYNEMFIWVANYDKALKMLHAQTCTWDFFLHLFWLVYYGRLLLLTNLLVVLMRLTKTNLRMWPKILKVTWLFIVNSNNINNLELTKEAREYAYQVRKCMETELKYFSVFVLT